MRLLADENFNNDILRGLLRVDPTLDIIRVQDTPLYQAPDPAVLEWAAQENRVLLTHDVQTMTDAAYDRLHAGLPMPGVIEVIEGTPVGQVIDELLVTFGATTPGELENRILYIPLS
jgi:hypothetical protein